MSSQIVEINLISAQGLKPPPGPRRIQAYAVAWVDPSAKLRTAIDRAGGENPTWNEKFVFRVPTAILSTDSPSALSVEIYSSGGWCFPDSLVGAVRLLLANLRLLDLPRYAPAFAAVGVRRPSGRFHGVLNVGAAVLSHVPVLVSEALAGTPAVGYRDFLRRSLSGSRVLPPPSPAAKDPVLKECNRELNVVRGDEKEGGAADDGGLAHCGLGFQRRIHASPSDQNLVILEPHDKEHRSRGDGRL
ncbi:hypothetical protein HPP92_005213 [Vanilla planifolia]|uniref:C2 domain-containing protein n=1 Tax=Vanilla planifolia TaxID=51239 RepID=A0A835RRR6_VANPL|nr:hypothetical protein HPP92_005509 [Vanilla planifolia]KAG0494219.1 hypothetical protein HPP92_005213 [Vanilla planifolia]